jgi:hypothetical protein
MKALDVWLRFAEDDDEEAEAEANTFATEDGRFRVEWYLTSVGLVKGVGFDTLAEAHAWLTREGFQDFSS